MIVSDRLNKLSTITPKQLFMRSDISPSNLLSDSQSKGKAKNCRVTDLPGFNQQLPYHVYRDRKRERDIEGIHVIGRFCEQTRDRGKKGTGKQ